MPFCFITCFVQPANRTKYSRLSLVVFGAVRGGCIRRLYFVLGNVTLDISEVQIRYCSLRITDKRGLEAQSCSDFNKAELPAKGVLEAPWVKNLVTDRSEKFWSRRERTYARTDSGGGGGDEFV